MNRTVLITGLKIGIAVLATFAVIGFSFYEGTDNNNVPPLKIIQPAITVNGNLEDTIYQYSEYEDQGASYLNDKDGIRDCYDNHAVSDITGTVNPRILGTYHITYKANDTAGHPLAPVTRTVHVVKNRNAFLNGNYNVSLSCTVTPRGPGQPTITAGTYTAIVQTEHRNSFKLLSLNVGPEKLVAGADLTGDSISCGFWSPDYTRINIAGKLAPDSNSFTLESTIYPYDPMVIYHCKSVFSKQLVIAQNR